MSVLLILLVASLVIASAFLGAFIWSVRNGQYDDDYTPSVRMLFDDRRPVAGTEAKKTTTKAKTHNGSKQRNGDRPA